MSLPRLSKQLRDAIYGSPMARIMACRAWYLWNRNHCRQTGSRIRGSPPPPSFRFLKSGVYSIKSNELGHRIACEPVGVWLAKPYGHLDGRDRLNPDVVARIVASRMKKERKLHELYVAAKSGYDTSFGPSDQFFVHRYRINLNRVDGQPCEDVHLYTFARVDGHWAQENFLALEGYSTGNDFPAYQFYLPKVTSQGRVCKHQADVPVPRGKVITRQAIFDLLLGGSLDRWINGVCEVTVARSKVDRDIELVQSDWKRVGYHLGLSTADSIGRYVNQGCWMRDKGLEALVKKLLMRVEHERGTRLTGKAA